MIRVQQSCLFFLFVRHRVTHKDRSFLCDELSLLDSFVQERAVRREVTVASYRRGFGPRSKRVYRSNRFCHFFFFLAGSHSGARQLDCFDLVLVLAVTIIDDRRRQTGLSDARARQQRARRNFGGRRRAVRVWARRRQVSGPVALVAQDGRHFFFFKKEFKKKIR